MHTDVAFDDADLNGYVDGRIEPGRAAALAESLASDPAARARVDAWRRQNDSLRTMFASVLCEPVPLRLLPAAVPKRDAAPDAPRPARRGAIATTRLGIALIGFVLGALAGVGTDGFGLVPSSRPAGSADQGPALAEGSVASRAVEAHRTYLSDPAHAVEFAPADEPKLVRWIHRRLGAVRIPSLARQGWAFLGGRIVPGRGGPAALLAYGSGADRLGLLVSRGPEAGEPRVAAAEDGGLPPLGVATWDDGPFAYALTADRGRDWLERNLGPIRDSVRAQGRAAAEDAPAP